MSANTVKAPHKVKIRKIHRCQGCGKKINVGETVTSSTFSDNGEIYTFYECDECVDFRNNKCFKCDDFEICMGENYEIRLISQCKNALI